MKASLVSTISAWAKLLRDSDKPRKLSYNIKLVYEIDYKMYFWIKCDENVKNGYKFIVNIENEKNVWYNRKNVDLNKEMDIF